MAGTWLAMLLNSQSYIFRENNIKILVDYVIWSRARMNHFCVFQVWNLGPSKVETAMIEIEIPHQLEGPNGEQIFMQVFEPQVS
jgi:hypothetical protein